jgi:hypothetical protein
MQNQPTDGMILLTLSGPNLVPINEECSTLAEAVRRGRRFKAGKGRDDAPDPLWEVSEAWTE